MHAAIVTAYTDFPTLRRLVVDLSARKFRIFVHVDTKAPYTGAELRWLARTCAAVCKRHSINWGHHNHLRAILDLIDLALADHDIHYIHTLSGQDYPIAPQSTIDHECDGRIFMTVTPLNELPDIIARRYYHYKLLPSAIGKVAGWCNSTASLAQRALKLRRRSLGPFCDVYKGMVWLSMPAQICRHLLTMSCENGFAASVRTTYLPEEVFFQTMIMNSEYSDKIVNDNRRFTIWQRRHNSRPAILDMTDLDAIGSSDCFFARKMHSDHSAALMTYLPGASALPAH